jgi:dihydropteroate synthase
VQIINIKYLPEAVSVFKKIGVDPYGISAMIPKTINLNILLEKQSCKIANIIKQEMLSVGGDAAVTRESVSCRASSSDILIMGTIKQILALIKKIEKQPFGLNLLAAQLSEILINYQQSGYRLKTSRREISLGQKTLIMGVLNVTPDSFSDGGLFDTQDKALERGIQMAAEGADMIDVGGESTRPGAAQISAKVEMKRVLPVIDRLSQKIKIPISIDTRKAQVAREALAAGAEIVNDISAIHHDKKMTKIVRDAKAGLILMHMRGVPQNMQKGDLHYANLQGEIVDYLRQSIKKVMAAGIDRECLAIDPGIGFGKTPDDNFKIMKHLAEFKILGVPIVIGTSRKSFIGKISGGEPKERIEGTAATVAAAIMNGCNIVRVHDVVYMKKVAAITDAIVHA